MNHSWKPVTEGEWDYSVLDIPGTPVRLRVRVDADANVGRKRVPHFRWAIFVQKGPTPLYPGGRAEQFDRGVALSHESGKVITILKVKNYIEELAQDAQMTPEALLLALESVMERIA